ncbi:hypothetical protein A7P96_04950 [Eikenella sp. NML03-A-027]|uniref:hypothetical protein n=1 Tax=Eikenella sp. NML03-A-027 TaxID=1795828 RepID=UPI0007DE9FD9|nr:hypothetical protein [Eikenella sp. NML03-A-027]OAM31635.1 hypothetical protein A7P96_04950 [Eikenella sp. NML03-A-027]
MSPKEDLYRKTYPLEANSILSMAASVAGAAIHHYRLNPKSEDSRLMAITIPLVRKNIAPIVEDAYYVAKKGDKGQDIFLDAVFKTVMLLDTACKEAAALGLAEETPNPTIQ